jgi:hypothetical protein
MKRHIDKLSLRQPKEKSSARATGFSKEQVGIFFNLCEKDLVAHDYPPSIIVNVDETCFNSGLKETTKNPRIESQKSDWRFNCSIKNFFNKSCCMHECQWNLVSPSNFTVEMLPYCYISLLFLNNPESCLVTSNSIRNYQPLFPHTYFALLLLKLLYLLLDLSNHLWLSQATK